MFQAPQNLGVDSANVACIRPGVPLSQNLNTGKGSQLCSVDLSDVDSMAPVCHPALPRVSADMLIKVWIFSLVKLCSLYFEFHPFQSQYFQMFKFNPHTSNKS